MLLLLYAVVMLHFLSLNASEQPQPLRGLAVRVAEKSSYVLSQISYTLPSRQRIWEDRNTQQQYQDTDDCLPFKISFSKQGLRNADHVTFEQYKGINEATFRSAMYFVLPGKIVDAARKRCLPNWKLWASCMLLFSVAASAQLAIYGASATLHTPGFILPLMISAVSGGKLLEYNRRNKELHVLPLRSAQRPVDITYGRGSKYSVEHDWVWKALQCLYDVKAGNEWYLLYGSYDQNLWG